MRAWHCLTSLAVAASIASCTPNSQPNTAPSSSYNGNRLSASGLQQSAGKTAARPGQSNLPDAPVPPAGAQWTILCDTVEGPDHVTNAAMLKTRLAQLSGMPDWYVIHSEKQSTIYYGYYGSLDSPPEKIRAENDRTHLIAMTDRLGDRVLRGGILVPVTTPDPQAPSEWNLVNTPATAYWTMEIAVFADNPKRKEAAVQMVRDLRQQGETEAYYYHGPTASSVCIGAWPRDAVEEQGLGIDRNGKSRDDAHSTGDPTQPLLVYEGDVPLPATAKVAVDPASGRRMTVQKKELVVNDPDMKKKMQQYPNHSVNYEIHAVQKGSQLAMDPSVLVVIPRDQSGTGEDDWRLTGGAPSAQPAEPRRTTAAGDDVLRSLPDK